MAKKSSDINIVTAILATSAAVLLTSNTFLFIMGCVCGHCLSQKCKKLTNREDVPNQPVPLYYENLQLRAMKPDENEPGLSQNMAYGYLQRQNTTDTWREVKNTYQFNFLCNHIASMHALYIIIYMSRSKRTIRIILHAYVLCYPLSVHIYHERKKTRYLNFKVFTAGDVVNCNIVDSGSRSQTVNLGL